MSTNNNGYVGVSNEFKQISKRYIGVGSSWKDQDFKFMGENGYWRMIYTKNPINLSSPFYVRYLDGYSLELENSLTLFGANFKSYQLLSPKIGCYYELEKNASDLFENFANGSYIGVPAIGKLLGGEKCMGIETGLAYFQPHSSLDAIGMFGSTGAKDYSLSQHFYIYALPVGTDVIPLLSYGDRKNGMEIVVSSSGRLQQKVWNNDKLATIETKTGLINTGWNAYVITKTSNVVKIYLQNKLTEEVSASQNLPSPLVGTFVKVGASYKYSSIVSIPQAFSTVSASPRFTLSNSDKTIRSIAAGAGTARSNNIISPNTGKYYFEVKLNSMPVGVAFIGLGDAAIDSKTAVGIAGWSISSNSRTFNKQTGGGTAWGAGSRTFTTGDVISCVYDSGAGTAVWYKNNILLGTSTSAITGDVNFMVSCDINITATIRIEATEWEYTPQIPGAIEMPRLSSFTGLEYYSTQGTGHKYFHYSPSELSIENIDKLLNRANPVVVFKNKATQAEVVITEEWMLTVSDDKIIVTVPNYVPYGQYELFIRYFSGLESFRFPVSVSKVTVQGEPFTDTFNDPKTLSKNYYVLNRAWGGANGGTIIENVFIRDNELILRGHGDNYTGDVQGRDRVGNLKFHTDARDPKVGLPWVTRTGGCAVFNRRTGFGSYEVDSYIPNKLGLAYAIWTFFYNEIYPSDPRYNDFLIEGLHQQGSLEDGFYLTRNHEIDIEFPSHLDGGILSQPSLDNMKCNTWRGELQNWDVPTTDPTYWEEYRDNLTPVGFSVADGQYHKLRFDWYPDRVEFYIDGVLKRTNINTANGDTIPDISGFFTLGVWFPSSPIASKPWLVNPSKAWGGGVIGADGGMKADFDVVEMRVRQFKFIPFTEFAHLERRLGETYPFGGYNKRN